MSGIIKKAIKFALRRIELGILLGVAAVIVCIVTKNIAAAIVLSLLVLVMAAVKLDSVVRQKIKKSVSAFTPKGTVRNADILVIGDMVDTDELRADGVQVVEACAPERALCASFEILRHTYSILGENGKVVIACRECNIEKQDYSVIDVAYFHKVTVKRLSLGKLKKMAEFPLFSDPVRVIRWLSGRRNKFETAPCLNAEIADFCRERGLELEFRVGK